MEICKLQNTHNQPIPRAVVVFLGWGMSAAPFYNLKKAGYDIFLLSDYADYKSGESFSPLISALKNYAEVVVVAWSFGVRIANDFMLQYGDRLPVTRTLAVNGTITHIDNRRGIPESVFRLTLRRMSKPTVANFIRRMFAEAPDYEAFVTKYETSARGLESLTAELEMFGALDVSDSPARWDLALIGEKDAIFPPDNQANAWRGTAQLEKYPSWGHFPDFQHILDRYITDKSRVGDSFSAAAYTYEQSAEPQARVAETLWARLCAEFETRDERLPLEGRIIEVGCGSGLLTRLYADRVNPPTLELWDLAPAGSHQWHEGARYRQCDAEIEIAKLESESIDLILSASAIQWFNSPSAFISRAVRALRPGGILAVAGFGPGTLEEISSITGNSLPYIPINKLIASAGTVGSDGLGVEILFAEEETIIADFGSSRELIDHLRLTGVNALSRSSVGRTRQFLNSLGPHPSLTYRPYYLILRRL